jgi:hypothetical protein
MRGTRQSMLFIVGRFYFYFFLNNLFTQKEKNNSVYIHTKPKSIEVHFWPGNRRRWYLLVASPDHVPSRSKVKR